MEQKVVLARWMAMNPKLIIFDEPTKGIDVGAKSKIYHMICEAAKRGVAVIMIFSKLTEVIGISDRMLVSISSLSDSVEVPISDDGVGMDPQTLGSSREGHRGFNSVGLSNVDERLLLYYGEESKLTIESTKNIGIVISFTIPRESRYNESGG